MSVTGELQSPLAFGCQTDQTPGGSGGGDPAGREVSSAPINTPSPGQAAKRQGSGRIYGRLAGGVGGWEAEQTGQAGEGPQGQAAGKRPCSLGAREVRGQRRNLCLGRKRSKVKTSLFG